MYVECGGILNYHWKFIPDELVEKYGKSNKCISEMVRCIERFSQKEVTDIKECSFPCEEIEYTTMPTFNSQSMKDDPKPTSGSTYNTTDWTRTSPLKRNSW